VGELWAKTALFAQSSASFAQDARIQRINQT
jgi:hypothetical protein